MSDLDSIRSRHTQRGDTCSLCGLGWPCDAIQAERDRDKAWAEVRRLQAVDQQLTSLKMRIDSVLDYLDTYDQPCPHPNGECTHGQAPDLAHIRELLTGADPDEGIERPLIDRMWGEDWNSPQDATYDLPNTDVATITAEMKVRLPAQLGAAVGITKFRDGTEREWAVYVPGPVHPDRQLNPEFNGWLVYCVPQWLIPVEETPQDLNIGIEGVERPSSITTPIDEPQRRRAPGGCEDEVTH